VRHLRLSEENPCRSEADRGTGIEGDPHAVGRSGASSQVPDGCSGWMTGRRVTTATAMAATAAAVATRIIFFIAETLALR
jgi:hypothetical protein